MEENTLINFMMEQKEKYSPGLLWCIYSIVGKWYKVEEKFNIKQWGKGNLLFGLLQKKEVLKINCEDVRFVEEKNQYDIATAFVRKTGAQTVSFELPEHMTTGMSTYLDEILKKKGRLLKKFNAKSKTCIQNVGKHLLHSWPTQATEMLELNAAGYSGTCWHRSGATAMANSVAGIINLKRAG
eukprot:14409091-Ditylum_brightwellii.AAC.1